MLRADVLESVAFVGLAGALHSYKAFIHLTIGGCYYDDCTVHRSGASYHIFDIIGVARAVNMGIVSVVGLIFEMGG